MLPDRQRPTVRFTPDQADRLKRVLAHRNLTAQAFLTQWAMRGIEEAEAEMRTNREDKSRRREAKESRRVADEPMGLGLRPRSEARDIDPLPPAVTPGQVVVNVAQPAPVAPSAPKDLIATLAAFVVTGPEYAREERKRTAVEMLRSAGSTEEERLAMATRLDEAIAARIREEPGDFAAARQRVAATFEQIKGFLK